MLLAVGAVYVAVNLLKNGWTAIIVALNVFFITFNLIGVILTYVKTKSLLIIFLLTF